MAHQPRALRLRFRELKVLHRQFSADTFVTRFQNAAASTGRIIARRCPRRQGLPHLPGHGDEGPRGPLRGDAGHRGDPPPDRARVRATDAAGYTVVGLADGAEGLARLPELTPDLILLDMMPGMDGFEFLARLRANPVAAARVPRLLVDCHEYNARGASRDRDHRDHRAKQRDPPPWPPASGWRKTGRSPDRVGRLGPKTSTMERAESGPLQRLRAGSTTQPKGKDCSVLSSRTPGRDGPGARNDRNKRVGSNLRCFASTSGRRGTRPGGWPG